MAISNSLSGESFNQQTARQFIAEFWLPEMMAFRQQRLFQAEQFCKTFGATVKRGDVFHIPRIGEMMMEDKQTDQPISIQNDNNDDYEIRVDSDRVIGIGIDNFAEAMASYAFRQPYVSGMGYVMAKDLCGAILGLRASLYGISTQNVFASSTGTIAGNGQTINRAAILAAREILLDADVDENNLVCMVSPGQETDLLSIDQLTSSDYVSGKPQESGMIGNLYGVNFFRTSLLRANSATGWIRRVADQILDTSPTPGFTGSRYFPRQDPGAVSLPATFTGNSTPVHTAIMCSKEWAAAVMQNNISPEVNYLPDRMLTLIAARHSYGAKLYRREHAVLIHTTV